MKNIDGQLSVQEITKEGHGGTTVGALIGALAGLPAGPAAAAIMAAGGAAIGDAADLMAKDSVRGRWPARSAERRGGRRRRRR